MKIVSFLLLIAWCWCLWLFLYLQTSRTTTPAADASGYLKRFAILRNLVRLQKPEVKAPQSKVVSYGTSFFLVAEGSSVVSTSSENQKLLQLSDLGKRETGGSAWRKMGGPLGKQWESVKLEGQVHVRPLCDMTQIQSHYRADPSLLWGAHTLPLPVHRVLWKTARISAREVRHGPWKSDTKSQHSKELWRHYKGSEFPEQRDRRVPQKLQREGERKTIWGKNRRPLDEGGAKTLVIQAFLYLLKNF